MGWGMGIWISGKMIFSSSPVPGVTNTIHIAYDNKYYVNINHALELFPPYGDTLNGSRMRFWAGIYSLSTSYAFTFGIQKVIHRLNTALLPCLLIALVTDFGLDCSLSFPYIKRYTPFRFASFRPVCYGSYRFDSVRFSKVRD